ncbi:MAG: hypothetical protein Q9221_003466 [Calogaya cf. arnoldii]
MVNLYTVLGVGHKAENHEIDDAWSKITGRPVNGTGIDMRPGHDFPGSKCNYYTVLGVGQDATQDEITHAYRDITLPPEDVVYEGPRDERLLNVAFYTLMDRDARTRYDAMIQNNPMGSGRDSDLLKIAKKTLSKAKKRSQYDSIMWNTEWQCRHTAKDDVDEYGGVVNGPIKGWRLREYNKNKSSKVGLQWEGPKTCPWYEKLIAGLDRRCIPETEWLGPK